MNKHSDTLPVNDPKLFKLTEVKCLKPFRVKGEAVAVGDVVRLEYHVARDLVAIHKAEWA